MCAVGQIGRTAFHGFYAHKVTGWGRCWARGLRVRFEGLLVWAGFEGFFTRQRVGGGHDWFWICFSCVLTVFVSFYELIE